MATIKPVIIHVSVARDEPRSAAMSSSETVTIVISDPNAITANMTTTSSRR